MVVLTVVMAGLARAAPEERRKAAVTAAREPRIESSKTVGASAYFT
jgi:hypothetical protein